MKHHLTHLTHLKRHFFSRDDDIWMKYELLFCQWYWHFLGRNFPQLDSTNCRTVSFPLISWVIFRPSGFHQGNRVVASNMIWTKIAGGVVHNAGKRFKKSANFIVGRSFYFGLGPTSMPRSSFYQTFNSLL